MDNDDNMLADFGHTDSTFWRKRLAKSKHYAELKAKTPVPEPDTGDLYEEDGVLYRKEGDTYIKVGTL